MKIAVLIYLICSAFVTFSAHAALRITLTTEEGSEFYGSPKPDFVVTIHNPESETTNISEDWQRHALIVDGKSYPIMQTMWWCIESPKIKPEATFKKRMFLIYYQSLSLKAGKHEIQFKLGEHLSDKMTIILEHDFESSAGSWFSA